MEDVEDKIRRDQVFAYYYAHAEGDRACVCCGRMHVTRTERDPWEGRLDGYCYDCATARCDAYPGDAHDTIPYCTDETCEYSALHHFHPEPGGGKSNYYVRTASGQTHYVDSLRAGLMNLTGEDGYRLTISDGGGNEVVIRKAQRWHTDTVMGGVSAACNVTVRMQE